MRDKMRLESPILRENLEKSVTKEEGPGYGEELSKLDFKKLPIWVQNTLRILAPAVIGLAALKIGETVRTDLSLASELGTTSRVLLTPKETMREMREFDERIKETNQEPRTIVAQTIPSSSEIQLSVHQKEYPPSLVSIRNIRFVSEEEMERIIVGKRSELSLSQHSFTFFEHSPDQVRQIDSALDNNLRKRTENLLQEIKDGAVDLNPKTDEFRDFYIYAYHNGLIGEDTLVKYLLIPDSKQLYLTLAGHELEYIRNPLVQRAAAELEMSGAIRAINAILGENVNLSLFNEGKLPQIPETKQEILDSVIFAGGDSRIGGGLGYQDNPLLIGGYDRQDISYDEVKKNFVNSFTHEAIHSFFQFDSEGLQTIDWSSPKGRLIHALHGIPEVMAGWISEADQSEPNPIVVFVYGVLKEGGVEDPLSEMLSSMATASYLISYDEVRGNHLSVDEVFAQDNWEGLSPEITKEIMEMYYQYRDDFMRKCLGEHFKQTESEIFIGNICGVQSVPEDEYYAKFSVAGYSYLQEKYDEYGGEARLGNPISKQIGEQSESNGVLQFFTHAALAFNYRKGSYPGMDLTIDHVEEEEQSRFKQYMMIPIGWYLYNDHLQREMPVFGEPGWVNPGDFQIDLRILDFYEGKGGVFSLGIPISNPIEIAPGKFVQWTTLARIEFTEDGQAQLAPVGEEYYRLQIKNNPEYCDYAFFPCLAYTSEQVAEVDPDLDRDLKQRTQKLILWLSINMGQDFWSCSSYERRTDQYRDWLIYVYHNGIIGDNYLPESVLAPSSERIYSTLAMHEFLIRDSFFPQVAIELEQPMEAINKMLGENLDPKLFYNETIPLMPVTAEDILNSVVLGRGDIHSREGLGYGDFSVLFGRYWLPGYPYEDIEEIFGDFFAHEKGHSNLQTYRASYLESLDWDSPEGYYVHELHYLLVDMVARIMGYREVDLPPRLGFNDPGLPPRIGYLYGHLVEEGYKPEEVFKILLNSLASSSCLYPDREIINRIYSKDRAYFLPEDTKKEIEEMNNKYWRELVDLYMRYSK